MTLIEREGTVPFLGTTGASGSASYPDEVTAAGRRYLRNEKRTFEEAIEVLPQAGEGDLWADNEFVQEAAGETVNVDVEAMRQIEGLDLSDVADATGESIAALASKANPSPVIPVGDHKDIIDRRRLALRTLGFEDLKFRWQIATDSYNPGDMREFFRRKIDALHERGISDAFGWLHHYDWGGSVTLVSIYPEMSKEVGWPDDINIGLAQDELTITDTPDVDGLGDDSSGGDSLTIYYGDRMGYDFRGSSTIWAYPVIYIPDADVMVPLPSPRFSRRHEGDMMDEAAERDNGRRSPLKWHEHILGRLEDLAASINQDILRARVAALDFSSLPFDIAQFYEFLGIPGTYAEVAAEQAASLANPADQPTIWNLQLSLKLALVDEFDGTLAGDAFQTYQEVAGELLQNPSQQIQLAVEECQRQLEEEDDEQLLPEDQQTLAESLGEIQDLPGITESDLSLNEAEQVDQSVQRRLSSLN